MSLKLLSFVEVVSALGVFLAFASFDAVIALWAARTLATDTIREGAAHVLNASEPLHGTTGRFRWAGAFFATCNWTKFIRKIDLLILD